MINVLSCIKIYLAVNASRLYKSKEELIIFYKDKLEFFLNKKFSENEWKKLLNAGIVCGFFMLFWTKALAVKNGRDNSKQEWDWWVKYMDRII